MKLSEAIRLGSMLKPQAFTTLSDLFGSCAIGAACEACGLAGDLEFGDLPAEWQAHQAFYAPCPVCGPHEFLRPDRWHSLEGELNNISHLNDEHKWTREQIADWVETIEQQQEAEARRAVAEGQPMEPAEATAASFAQK